MNIDFHYGAIYVVARLGGLPVEAARTVAHASQYVDDATTDGRLNFAGGESFERQASAHSLVDLKNFSNAENCLIWAPFHFLPGGQGETLAEKVVCVADSAVARQMVRNAIVARQRDDALHRLGVTLHAYADTWAHEGFSGLVSAVNRVEALHMEDEEEAGQLEQFLHHLGEQAASLAMEAVSLGHGAALHCPDLPWASWGYTNWRGEPVSRDNLSRFLLAAHMACKAVQAFVRGTPRFEAEPGLSAEAQAALSGLWQRCRDLDAGQRLACLAQALQDGEIPGLREALPAYVAKGAGSWKQLATGIEDIDDGAVAPAWSAEFECSDYRKFHDALKQHRQVVTQEILPAHQIRLV